MTFTDISETLSCSCRWGDTRVSMTWAGCHIKTVDIDMYGHFSFVLVKVADNTKAHRLLVRGRQSRTHADLMKSLTSEVSTNPFYPEAHHERHKMPSMHIQWNNQCSSTFPVYSHRLISVLCAEFSGIRSTQMPSHLVQVYLISITSLQIP